MTDFFYRHEWKFGVVAVAMMLVLFGCGAHSIDEADTGNREVTAEKLAVIEGCNLYRVRDGSRRTVYVTICPGSVANASWQENCGKNCTRQVDSQTLIRQDDRS